MLRAWLLGLCVLLMTVQPAAALAVKDDLGRTTALTAPPQRIVSLLPSLTETVCALGACERLVGVDRYSNHPQRVNALPKLGGLDDTQVERIAALKPDLVLLSSASRVVDRLAALGLKVVALEPHSYADVPRVMDTVGQLLGTPDAHAVWRRIEAGIAAAAGSVPPRARGLKVYYEVADGIWAAGEASFLGEMLSRLGAVNIVPTALGPFPKINPEFVVKANPDLIMIGQTRADALARRPGWSGIAAIRNQRVCNFSAEQGDILARPGPRLHEAAQILARCLAEHAP